MSNIEKWSKIIASEISKKLSLDDDNEEVLAYGTFAFLQMAISIFMIIIFGIILDVLKEIILISFSAAILRKYSGGAHATTPMNCAISGAIVFGGIALIVKHIIMKIDYVYILVMLFMTFAFTFIVMIKHSPVGSVNKPLRKEANRKRLKKQSLECTFLFFILIIAFVIKYLLTKNFYWQMIAVCISSGIAWQSITLVSLGHYIIDKLEWILRGTKKIMRRAS